MLRQASSVMSRYSVSLKVATGELAAQSGAVQRQVERFVYQLQRDARRFDKDDEY